LLILDAAIVLYAGILAIYIVTMPTSESLVLAGFERYASSIVIFFIDTLALCAEDGPQWACATTCK